MTLREIRSAHPTYAGVAGAVRLATAIGGLCSPSTIRRWESGHPIPERAEDRLCVLLGLTGQQRRSVLSATRDLQHARTGHRVGRLDFSRWGKGHGGRASAYGAPRTKASSTQGRGAAGGPLPTRTGGGA